MEDHDDDEYVRATVAIDESAAYYPAIRRRMLSDAVGAIELLRGLTGCGPVAPDGVLVTDREEDDNEPPQSDEPLGLSASMCRAGTRSPLQEALRHLERLFERGWTTLTRSLIGGDSSQGAPFFPQDCDPTKIDRPAQNDAEACVVCEDRAICTAILECGHCIMCLSCALTVTRENKARCPVCRLPIARIVRVIGR